MSTPFSITFSDVPLVYEYDDRTTAGAEGELAIGDYRESFLSSLYEWTKEDYERQWRDAVTSLLEGASKAALITEYIGPDASSHLQWWPLYRCGDVVYAQNHFLFYDQQARSFVVAQAFDFVPDRRTASEDGDPISEWSVPLSSLQEFADNFA
ncbi:MAG TPA: hypothetical protein VII58_13530 [Acidobacteriaceae bacterium]